LSMKAKAKRKAPLAHAPAKQSGARHRADRRADCAQTGHAGGHLAGEGGFAQSKEIDRDQERDEPRA
jgi:hypothetical protein